MNSHEALEIVRKSYGKPRAVKCCECSDRLCPVHKDKSVCRNVAMKHPLYRVDMVDATGTLFCEECSFDAYSSGLFTDKS